MQVCTLIHESFEGLGAIHNWLQKKNYHVRETHSYRGDALPQVQDFDGLIVMGGPQDLKDLKKYPYLQDEIRLIKQAIQQDKLVLGVCLGAQLIAESLGAKTEASPEKEIGVFPLQLTQQGYADPVMRHFPDSFPATHWHNDMPGLPAGAAVLAASRGCPRQIICFKPRVYGLQCHFELTREDISKMVNHSSGDLTPGRYIQTKAELLNQDYSAINQLMFQFLDHFSKVTKNTGGLCAINY